MMICPYCKENCYPYASIKAIKFKKFPIRIDVYLSCHKCNRIVAHSSIDLVCVSKNRKYREYDGKNVMMMHEKVEE